MAETFQCPSCYAPLDYEGDGDPVVKCDYCHNTVIVPESLRGANRGSDREGIMSNLEEVKFLMDSGRKIEAIKKYRETFGGGLKEAKEAVEHLAVGEGIVLPADEVRQAAVTAGKVAVGASVGMGMVGLIVSVALCIGVGVAVFAFFSVNEQSISEPNLPEVLSVASESSASGLASSVLTFGQEGTGAGFFSDARLVAVDGEGQIYVGEYGTGRVQVFDSQGGFLTQWILPDEPLFQGMDVSREGTLYLTYKGRLERYEGMTGRFIDQIEYADGHGFEDVDVLADGSAVAAWISNGDAIVRFDADGGVDLVIPEAISGQSGDSELDIQVAVDGLGTIYALGGFNDAVFVYGADGSYQNRFGSSGSEPGQFRAANAIAVDAQGQVYVGDMQGVQVFGSDGRYIDTIAVDGAVRDLTFTPSNELVVVTSRQAVHLFTLADR